MADPDALLQAQLEATIEPNVREEPLEYGGVGVGLMYWMAQAGAIMPPWWSKARDQHLRKFWKDADHLASAFWMIGTKLASVPFVIVPRDHTIKGHVAQATYYNTLLQEGIQFGGGWSEFWMPFFIDLWTMDNGAFGEVIGGGEPDGPIEGPALGLRHLDSWRCSRTSSPEFPVIYQTTKGAKHKLHHSRVIFVSQLPSPAAEMYGVGHSWSTRAINTAQHLVDISVYKQEKLGSRPPRQLLIGRGMSTKELGDALRLSNEDMDNQGLTRFSKTALIAGKNPEIGIDRIDLATTPDGFDERSSTELGMYLIALAGGFPPRWLWPATTTGATKADAMYQHIAGTGGGASWHIQMMTRLLGGSPKGAIHKRGKVLPPHLKIIFDYQDDEQDRAQSEIRKTRADVREKNLNTGSTTVRVNREQMLQDSEISEAQFREMELNEGRLPDGESVMTLFVSEDPVYKSLLDLGVDEPLLTAINDPATMLVAIDVAIIKTATIATNDSNKKLVGKAKNANAALIELKERYESLVVESPPELEEEDLLPEDNDEDLPEVEKMGVLRGLWTKLTGKEEEMEEVLLKSEASFRGAIRQAIRGGWTGHLDMFGVTDAIIGAISHDLADAWNQGALSCGIKEEELTAEELNAREVFVNGQMVYVFDFASVVVETGNDHRESPRDRSFNLGPLMSRGEVWANRWPEAFTMGKTMACANQKLKWVLGEAEHCSSCLKLNGKVKRASFWQDKGILPRVAGAGYLECKGWRCQCNLVETEDSLSKGPLPKLP